MDVVDNILAVYGDTVGSDDVLLQAVMLARASRARLTIVNALGEYPQSQAAVEEARRRLSRIVPWLQQEGVDDVATEVLVGTPYIEITRMAVCGQHDLVIVGTECGGGLKDRLRGGTAVSLMRKCPCPVWVVKPRQPVPSRAVMAAVDAPVDGSVEEINDKILAIAMAVAEAQKAHLHVVHCWTVTGSDADMVRSEIRDNTKRAIYNKHEAQHREAVQRMLARYEGRNVEISLHLPRSLPQPGIVAMAGKLDVDLVVMGTTSRVGIPGLLMGNAAERILDEVSCGVLAVKPDGFRSSIAVERAAVHSGALGLGGH